MISGPVSRTPLFFDEASTPPSVRNVLRISSLLSIGEFQLFEIAYQNWYGEAADEKLIEKYFVPYMFHDRIPFWVRHFCNRIEELEERGMLDADEFRKDRERPAAVDYRGKPEYLILFSGAVVLYFALLLRFLSGA